MLKRYLILLSFCLMVVIMASCSNDRISIIFHTWVVDELSADWTDTDGPCDDQTLYFYINKEAQINIVAVMNGKFLSSFNSVILEADDPAVVEVTPETSDSTGVSNRLLVLQPEARKAHLTLTLKSQDRIIIKKIALVIVKRVDLQEGFQAIDFDTGEFVTESQWDAMDAVQRASFDLLLNRREYSTGSASFFEFSLNSSYGHLSLPPRLFAAYDFYPESTDIPSGGEFTWDSASSPYIMFVAESSEGRIYKILLDGRWFTYAEILK